jgi:hypothetical protein
VHALTALAVLRLGLSLSLGPEWDSNANRAEIVSGSNDSDTPQASFLLRTTAQGWLSWLTTKNALRVTAGLGGKIFFDPAVQDQDVLVLQLGAEDRVRVHRHFHLAVVTDYYDAWQPPTSANRRRDFRNGNAQLRAYLVHHLGEITLTGGYRGFQYKPNSAFTFEAGQLTLGTITRLRFGPNGDHELDFASSYHFERRFFPVAPDAAAAHLNESQHVPPPTHAMPACSLGQPFQTYCLYFGPDLRNDWLNEMGVEATYVGPLLVTLGYSAQLNTSSSFGQSLLRHIFTIKLGYRFPWSLYGAVKAQLFVTKYLDPVLLAPTINAYTFNTIEDENRNALLLDLERPIGTTGLAIDARYSWFTNELASQSTAKFERHVVYLGLTYRVGAR